MNGTDMIFGFFNVLDTLARMAIEWRRRGYVYKVFAVLGVFLLGLLTIGFMSGAIACFKHMGGWEFLVFGFLGIVCALLAIYSAFGFLVYSIAMIVIIANLISKQKVFMAEQRDGIKEVVKNEEAEQVKSVAKDQYQQESFHSLKPKKKKRLSFKEQLADQSIPYLKTKIGFDVAMLVLTCVILVAGIGFAFLAGMSI